MSNVSVEQQVVNTMFEAFKNQNLEQAIATVSEDSIWIHHGSQKLASLRFEGKSGVSQFFASNFTTIHMAYFDILKTIQQGDTVIVFGKEKFTMDERDGEFAQKWVQVYTVKNGLITRMEEYATSADEQDYLLIQ